MVDRGEGSEGVREPGSEDNLKPGALANRDLVAAHLTVGDPRADHVEGAEFGAAARPEQGELLKHAVLARSHDPLDDEPATFAVVLADHAGDLMRGEPLVYDAGEVVGELLVLDPD